MTKLYSLIMALLVLLLTGCDSRFCEVILEDDFSDLALGAISPKVGPHTEYHFYKSVIPEGNWTVTCFQSRVQDDSWRVVEVDGRKVMCQTFESKLKHTHPMIVTGDTLWQNYRVEVNFVPQVVKDRAGVIFRYHNDRCYYFFGMYDQRLALYRLNHGTAFREENLEMLAEEPFVWQANKNYHLAVEVIGDNYKAFIDDRQAFDVTDSTWKRGKVALMADQPAYFSKVKISTSSSEIVRVEHERNAKLEEWAKLEAANPRPVLWKKISTQGFGVGRNLRFGDLNNDGQPDVLIGQVKAHGPLDRFSELGCITAMTFDGEVLWQTGTPDPHNTELTNDVAFQIHDIDNDGKAEVIYTMNCELVIADGMTGRIKKKIKTPELRQEQMDAADGKRVVKVWDRILGDCLFFCDLRGKGHSADIIIKDRYKNFWVFDEQLSLRWRASCTTGHYPYARDVDGDGKDELFMGYSMFKDSPRAVWSWDETIKDHGDGIAAVNMKQDGTDNYTIFCAGSDEGIITADINGNIQKHYHVGHVQNPAIADFRPDLPGLETVTVNFWGNQGIFHFLDAEGRIYADMEPVNYGSMCLPVNWTGKPQEFFIITPNVQQGGLFDGWGRKVLTFPDDGHPDMCNAILDITGDVRDEIVVWDENEIWVYTQSDAPLAGKLYKPVRNPLHNYSNYQLTVSEPGWSE